MHFKEEAVCGVLGHFLRLFLELPKKFRRGFQKVGGPGQWDPSGGP